MKIKVIIANKLHTILKDHGISSDDLQKKLHIECKNEIEVNEGLMNTDDVRPEDMFMITIESGSAQSKNLHNEVMKCVKSEIIKLLS